MFAICDKKKVFLLIVLLGVTLSMSSYGARTRNSYYSDELRTIAVQSKLSLIADTLCDGVHYGITTYQSNPVTIIVENGEVKHLGFYFFSHDQREVFNTSLCNFVERYALLLKVPIERHRSPNEMMEQDKVVFRVGNFGAIEKLAGDSSVQIRYHHINKINFFTWEKEGDVVCELGFPSSYKLLLGMEMDELDARLRTDIINTPIVISDSVQIFSTEDLVASITRDYYVKKGSYYYFAELNSDKYYQSTGLNSNEYCLMYNGRYPRQSLANVLTTVGLSNGFQLKIKQEVYGNKDSLYVIPLEKYVSFCIKSGCIPYFCVINEDNGVMDCELIMRNEILQYNHVMRMKVVVEDVKKRKGVINARLDAYVPTQYLKNLFNEIQQ